MFRLYDRRTRQVEAIEPAGRGLLRMYSCGPAGSRRAHIGDLRSCLIADLIRRNAEHRHHLTVLTCQNISDVVNQADGGGIDTAAEEMFRADCSALNLRPADNSAYFPGDVIDIHTGGIDSCFPHYEHERAQPDPVTGHEVVRHWVHGEQLRFGGAAMAASAGNAVFLDELAGRGLDPLALRLAFLEHGYREPVNLSWDALGAADRTLGRWRELVAEWAQSPSKPLSAPTAALVAAAFDDDLDTPAALAALHRLEQDTQAAPGAKFETFAHADQLLGLDLARDIGRVPVRPQSASG